MNHLMKMEDREIKPDEARSGSDRIREFKARISDETYLDQAIEKIATDLSHYLTK